MGIMGVAALSVVHQVAGIALLIVGLARHIRQRREQDESQDSRSRSIALMLTPVRVEQASGIGLSGVF
jgi:hypothetical protein